MSRVHLKRISYLTFSVLTVGSIYNYIQKAKAQIIYYKNELNEKIISMCPSIKCQKFYPSFFFQTSFLQTIISVYVPINENIYFINEPVVDQENKLAGNSIFWCHNKQLETNQNYKKKRSDVLIFILPGLTGGAKDSYINNLVDHILNQGYDTVVYNYRILSNEVKFTEEPVDIINDMHFTLQFIKSKYPQYKYIFAVGHSYGANNLVNYLGTKRDKILFDGAVSISNPFQIYKCQQIFQGTIYDYFLGNILANKLKKVQKAYEDGIKIKGFDVENGLKATSLATFDDYITRRFLNYNDTATYYNEFSCDKNIKNVQIPLLNISSYDDQISQNIAIPIQDIKNNPNTILYLTQKGGHASFIQGLINLKYWYPKPSLEFIEALLQIIQQNQQQLNQDNSQ